METAVARDASGPAWSDRESLRRFDRPVYYALGGLSNPDQYGEIAERCGLRARVGGHTRDRRRTAERSCAGVVRQREEF
jgi:hypothetical protein